MIPKGRASVAGSWRRLWRGSPKRSPGTDGSRRCAGGSRGWARGSPATMARPHTPEARHQSSPAVANERCGRCWSWWRRAGGCAWCGRSCPCSRNWSRRAGRRRGHNRSRSSRRRRFGDAPSVAVGQVAMVSCLADNLSVGPDSPAGRRSGRALNENPAREMPELHTWFRATPSSSAAVRVEGSRTPDSRRPSRVAERSPS